MSRFLFVVLLCAMLVLRATAQTNTASLQGTVAAASGAVIRGAAITMLNASGRVLKNATTRSTGQFSITGLAPGKYVIQIKAGQFQAASTSVEIVRGVPAPPLQITLQVRGANQQVNVNGQPDS